ncbi:MAG: methyl-accepting chemotaxis protein [Bacillota bacterium]
MSSLQTKLFLYIIALIAIMGLVMGAVIYFSSQKLVSDSIGVQAKNIAVYAKNQINAGDFARVMKQIEVAPRDKANQELVQSMPEYIRIRKKLSELRKIGGLKYLYTMAKLDGKNVYAVDGSEDFSPPGAVEENRYPGLDATYDSKDIYIGELTNDSKWGQLLTAYVPILDKKKQTVLGIVGADYDAGQVYAFLNSTRGIIAVIVIFILVAGIVAAYIFSVNLLKPLKNLSENVQKMRKGDLTVHLAKESEDEIGALVEAYDEMVRGLNMMISTTKEAGERVAAVSQELFAGVEQTTKANEQIAAITQEVAGKADMLLSSGKNSSLAMNELSEGIQNIVKTSTGVSDKSQEALKEAERGNKSMQKAVQQMNAIVDAAQGSADLINLLGDVSQRIGKIVDFIKGITSQTTLIALNAAIEAARAGEQGRGFAVVADRVRRLSDQSGEAALRISTLIEEIQDYTTRSMEAMNGVVNEAQTGKSIIAEVGGAFKKIVDNSQAIAKQIHEVSDAAEEMAASSSELTAFVQETYQNLKGNAAQYQNLEANTEEQLASMEEISRTTRDLKRMALDLQESISKFKV